MRGSISVVDGGEPTLSFRDRVELYRLDDGSHHIVARTGDVERRLGVADVSVSRTQDGDPPIELRATSSGVEVHNHRNHNPVEVVSIVSGRTREIAAGAVTTIDRDTVLEIGHHTRIRVSLEPEPAEADASTVAGAVESGSTTDRPCRDEIAAEPTVHERPVETSAEAIETATSLVVDCLPTGPAATALAKARTHHSAGEYGRAIERATQVRDLAANELAILATVPEPPEPDTPGVARLRTQSTHYDLDPDVVTAYERLPEPTTAGSFRGDRPPDSIPRAPDLSLAYDEIEKGDRIGTGGSADVFEATVTTPTGEYPIALKEPRVDAGDAASGLDFDHEARTWERLDDHDHIVGVIDWGTEPHPWIAMEYMDLGPLTGVAGRLTPRQAIWTLLGIVNGVYHAHTYGVAHLDLKPGNVLLGATGNHRWPVPKVADWGLAKVLLQRTRDFEGYTPLYAAPEQIEPDTFGGTDPQTDIYQLGALGYVLVTGQPPFSGEASEVIRQILESAVAPPSERAPGTPPGLDQVIQTALEKDKRDRYESIVYVRDDLQAIHESL